MSNKWVMIFTLFLAAGLIISQAFEDALDKSVQILTTLPREDGLILLSSNIFEEYFMSSRRNFSLVFVIGSKKAQCAPCLPAMAALANIAERFGREHHGSSEIFFGFLDFRDNIDFVKMLNINTAPFIFHIGPHQSMPEWDRIGDFNVVSQPKLLADWISEVSNVKVDATIPIDKAPIYYGVFLLIAAFVFYKIKWLRNVKFFGILCLLFICAMLSGFMWVNINNVPFMSANGERVLYMYPQNGAQFGFEVLIVMSFYAMTSGGLVLLTNKCPKYRKQKLLHSIGVLVCLGVAVLGFNQMASCYSKKSGIMTFHFSLF